MLILDGKKLNQEIAENLRNQISGFSVIPKLKIVQIGDDPASKIYIGMKIKYAEKIGALAEVVKFPADISEAEVLSTIEQINNDSNTHGIIIQLPIPADLDSSKIINSIKPNKDVDGLTATNIYKLVRNDDSGFVPATARGVVTLLQKNMIELSGQKVVIIGRSLLVGKSAALHFLNQNSTVTVCHSQTKNLEEHVKGADIVVVATGQPGLVNDEMLGKHQVVVDVGISVVNEKVVGDVNVQNQENLHALSLVPGGVGPMTVASLFENLVEAFKV